MNGEPIDFDKLVVALTMFREYFENPTIELGKFDNSVPYLMVRTDGPNDRARSYVLPDVVMPEPAPVIAETQSASSSTWMVDGGTAWVQFPVAPSPAANEQFAVVDPPAVAEPPTVDPVLTGKVGFAAVDPTTAVTSTTPAGVHQCPECPKAFDKEHGLRVHRIRAHGERAKHGAAADPARVAKIEARAKAAAKLADAQAKTGANTVDKAFPCPHCPKKFGTTFGLEIHVANIHPATVVLVDAPTPAPAGGKTQTALQAIATPAPATPVDGDRVVQCSECSFVTFAATSDEMMQHTFQIHKRTRHLIEKRPFTLGGDDDGGTAA